VIQLTFDHTIEYVKLFGSYELMDQTHDAFDALHKIDQQFARMESAVEKASRPYRFVILSDHGQSGGATFKQRLSMMTHPFLLALSFGSWPPGPGALSRYGHGPIADSFHTLPMTAPKMT
jgi:hypothetical protein